MQEERKQAELKQVRKGPTRKIPDRVGYDWNKFGRLIEIRERHLARKFLTIWTLKTFGRILPNTAKTHYQSVVLRRAFEGWKDEWWASRKEWCLTTIANCHYRYYLYNLAFQHWQMFMNMQKEKKSKVQQAVQFAHRNLMRLAWNRWEVLRELRMKKRMLDFSLELKKTKALQSAWNILQARLQQHHNLHIMEKQALKQRGQSSPQRIESKHWKQWQDCLKEAEDNHFQPLREVSLTMHSTFLQRSHFNHWRERLTKRRHMQELHHQVDVCFAEQMLPSCFESWVELTRQRRLQKQRKHKADIYNQHRLYTWLFSTWRSQTEKHKDHMLSERLAVLHEEQSHLQRVWRCWKEKMNEKEKQTASTQMYHDTLPYTTVTTWKDISMEQQDRRCQEQDSFTQNDQHIRKCAEDKGKQVTLQGDILPSCKSTKENRFGHSWAMVCHYRTLRRVFIALRAVTPSAVSAYHQQREALTRVQMSLNQVRLLQCFRQWRKEAAHARSEKIYMKRARWHHESTLLTKAMKAWNEHHDQNHINKVRKRQGIFLLRLKMYQKFFDLWKLKLQHRRREAELKERALWHWSLTLQAKVLCRWRWWVAEQHVKQEQAARAALVHRDEPLREDLKSCLTYAAHMKDPPAGPAEDSQEQEPFCLPKRSQRIHSVVRSCALHWKQKALGKPRTEQQIKQEPQKKKSVTFSCTTPELTRIPSPDSVEQGHIVEELRKLLANRLCRRQPCRPPGLLGSPLANLHKEMAITDTADAPESRLSSFNSRKAHVLLGESSSSSLLQSSVYPDVCVGESGGQANRVDPASSLTKELLSIQQEMNTYQKNRKQLRAWKKLREVLQSWIQTSGQDEQSEKNTVCQEIKELEERIDRLSTELAKQKPKMLQHSERIQHLQATLTCRSVLMASH